MRSWKLTDDDPLSLHLAADARLTQPSYVDDQIWRLTLGEGHPAAVAVSSSLGLRVRDFRLFVGLALGDGLLVIEPAQFAAPPVVEQFYVNYARVRSRPVVGIELVQEFWVPGSQVICGRLTVSNLSGAPAEVYLQLNGVLRPAGVGDGLRPGRENALHYLHGQSGALWPVVVMSPGAFEDEGSWPALSTTVTFEPVESRQVRWVLAARDSREASLATCGEWLADDWRAGLQAVADVNAELVEIYTGDRDWDAALAMAQKVTLAAFVGPTEALPHPSFVMTRTHDHGYSLAGTGADYDYQWDGQSALEAAVVLPQVALASPALAKGALLNFLHGQREDGWIDWKPGLAGQRKGMLAMPLLAQTAWAVYAQDEDAGFVDAVYDGLARFVSLWFSGAQDEDEDGRPEWRNTLQSGYDEHPAFVRWRAWGQGADISLAECPDLLTYLHHECRALAHMAQVLEADEDAQYWAAKVRQLDEALQGLWDEVHQQFWPVDRDSQQSPRGRVFGSGPGALTLEVFQTFDGLERVLVRVQTSGNEPPPPVEVTIYGMGSRGRRVETLSKRDFAWYWGLGTATSKKLYSEIERIEVQGVDDMTQVWVGTVGLQRQVLPNLLPLGTSALTDDQRVALVRLVQDEQRFWRPGGLPICSAADEAYAADAREGSGGVWPLWTVMMGEALVRAGARDVAAALFQKVMANVLGGLQADDAFREGYDSETGAGLGNRDYTSGAAIVPLFLRVVGVQVVHGGKVVLAGGNPLPWPVTIRHRGVTVVKGGEASEITFASGRTVVVAHQDAEQVVLDEAV